MSDQIQQYDTVDTLKIASAALRRQASEWREEARKHLLPTHSLLSKVLDDRAAVYDEAAGLLDTLCSTGAGDIIERLRAAVLDLDVRSGECFADARNDIPHMAYLGHAYTEAATLVDGVVGELTRLTDRDG
jgi:hypothetical protein